MDREWVKSVIRKAGLRKYNEQPSRGILVRDKHGVDWLESPRLIELDGKLVMPETGEILTDEDGDIVEAITGRGTHFSDGCAGCRLMDTHEAEHREWETRQEIAISAWREWRRGQGTGRTVRSLAEIRRHKELSDQTDYAGQFQAKQVGRKATMPSVQGGMGQMGEQQGSMELPSRL